MSFSIHKANFSFDCTNPGCPVKQMQRIITHSVEIQRNTFLNNVMVPRRLRLEMYTYPDDYKFYSYDGGKMYWYKHSAIEYFFRR